MNSAKGLLAWTLLENWNKVHTRRYFIDAVPKGKQYDYSNPAVQGVQFCSKLFEYEHRSQNKKHTFEQRKAYRLEKEKPILDVFWSWLDEQKPRKGSHFETAVKYAKNRKDTLMTYLEDGHCSFSNNLSENAIRPFTVGRKNWLFSATQKGATASALVYTMIEMAKANELNIYKYLTYLLEHSPSEDMSDEQLGMVVSVFILNYIKYPSERRSNRKLAKAISQVNDKEIVKGR